MLRSSVTPGQAAQQLPPSNKRQKLSQHDAGQNALEPSNTDGQHQSGNGQHQSDDGQHQSGDGQHQSGDRQHQLGDGQHQSDAAQRPRVVKVIRLHGINALCALDRKDEDSSEPGQWQIEKPSFALDLDSSFATSVYPLSCSCHLCVCCQRTLGKLRLPSKCSASSAINAFVVPST